MPRGRVSMNSTTWATSLASSRLPEARAASSFSAGQSASSARDDWAGRDRTDAKAVLEHLAPHRLHEAVDRPLRRCVHRLPGRGVVGGERTGHDDVARAARDHVRQHVVHVLHHDVDVEVQHAVDGRRVGIDQVAADVECRHWRGRCRAGRPARGCAASSLHTHWGRAGRAPAAARRSPCRRHAASSAASSRSISTTRAPAASMASVLARPMPDAAPVTAATLPSSSLAMIGLSSCVGGVGRAVRVKRSRCGPAGRRGGRRTARCPARPRRLHAGGCARSARRRSARRPACCRPRSRR